MSAAERIPSAMETKEPRFWRLMAMTQTRFSYEEYCDRLGRPLLNQDDIDRAQSIARTEHFGAFEPGGDPIRLFPPMNRSWPADFVRPRLHLFRGFSLDIFDTAAGYFVSDRLRQAMALPDEAAQFFPVDYVDTPDEVCAIDYHWLAWVNVERDVIDLERSDGWDEWVNSVTGEVERSVAIGSARKIVRDGFQPRFDLFSPYENNSAICATSALERRVMAAGLSGVGFDEYGCDYIITPYWRSDERGRRIITPGVLDG